MLDTADLGFSEEELRALADNLHLLDPDEAEEVERLLEELESRTRREAAKEDLIAFCRYMDPNYKVGAHHRVLADKLMALESGAKDRATVNMPPRHGKSELVSKYFPAWFIGRNPTQKIMMVSHTTDLAVDFGRKVRNLIDDPKFQEVFPGITLSQDSKSAGRWDTNKGGTYYATGVGSSLAGRGADMLIVDDPHSEQDVLNGNFEVFDKAYQWFTFGARTRLMPGGRAAVVACMVGDTPVLRTDGTETPLRDIRPGDEVMSYDAGRLVSRKVLNHQSNGVDSVFTIKTTSHSVTANARHPFLVQTATGELKWTRVRDLRPGDKLVSLKVAHAPFGREASPEGARSVKTGFSDIEKPQGAGSRSSKENHVSLTGAVALPAQKAKAGNAGPAFPENHTIDASLTRRTGRLGIMENGKVKAALLKVAASQLKLVECATTTTAKFVGLEGTTEKALSEGVRRHSSTATESPGPSMTACLLRKVESVRSAVSRRARRTPAPKERPAYSWTTATGAVRFDPFSATTATLRSDMQRLSEPLSPLPNTSDFTVERIESITPSGDEEVFDVQIEGTENFIANGLVSHNTRWHMDDLTGRLIRDMANTPEADQYDVVEFPAILEIKGPDGKITEKALWPEFFDLDALHRTRASMPVFQWNAQYQQNPTAESAAVVKREWWRVWRDTSPPEVDYIIAALDTATEEKQRADYTALTVWGVFFNEDEHQNQLILLEAIRRRVEFPELKKLVVEQYGIWEPDAFIVEKKNSGVALYQELRRTGMPLQEYMPHRGSGNKYARLQSVADIVASGNVWVPEARWADELVEEIASFPVGSHDDLTDSTVMALMRFRQGGFLTLKSDFEVDRDNDYVPYRAAYY